MIDRGLRDALPSAECQDQCHASGPGWQQIGHWEQFEHERWQQQRMESKQSRQNGRGYDVQNLVCERPAKRAEGQLEQIGRQRNAECDAGTACRQYTRLKETSSCRDREPSSV
jgi:hypothetical protein